VIARGPQTLRRFLVLLATGTLLIACEPARPPITLYDPPVTQEGTDAQLLFNLDRMRSQASLNWRGVWEHTGFAQVVVAAIEYGTTRRHGLDESRLIREALSGLEEAQPESPDDRARIQRTKEALLRVSTPRDPTAPEPPRAPDPPRPPQPPPAGDWMLTLRNACPRTVVLFFGRLLHSFGHFTSLSPGEKWQYSGLEGRSVWILDEHLKGLDKLPLTGTLRHQIQLDCSHFASD